MGSSQYRAKTIYAKHSIEKEVKYMQLKEFISKTGLSKKTAPWLYKNVFHAGEDLPKCKHANYTDANQYVLDRKVEQYSKTHNIKRLEEADDEYYIEDDGKVFSYKRGFLEERKYSIIFGYQYVTLWSHGQHKSFRVHRLVGKYFLPSAAPGCNVINHLDGNKMNNHASNLEWATVSGNTKHAFDTGLAHNDIGEEDSQSHPIDVYDGDGNLLRHFGSIKEAQRETGISANTFIRSADSGRASRKYKFSVKYA